ncbi:NlpC/P60 family protein [Alicyclobacillus sp.]|uniref:C40 family peptidase n=1 Tax=Alicyclobacillus sp. TaxID=61169 RepID=UPI0025C5A61D|nr:NlpC/P60 family protein [Alicyclobacillus sp.]MCL6517339.1 C40 family peptidase [Alicyclobacillus sp.]
MKKRLVLAGSALVSMLAFSGVASAGTYATYTVQSGDTMYKIALREGVSLAALEAANPQIADYNNIWVGEQINLPISPQEQKADAILATAQSLIGVPYQWGGDSPATGFDCSGFVQYVFGQNGISLPRESHDQATVGTFVPANQLRKGDLLFFTGTYPSNWPNGVTHVAIYLGNGDMIESSSARGGVGVIVVKNFWASPYYNAHYWGARRVIQ